MPPLVNDTLAFAGLAVPDIDAYLFHQSNRFIMKHLAKKCGLPEGRVPFVLDRFGNSGGPSVALALTQGVTREDPLRAMKVMLLGYGVGLSWGSALTSIPADAALLHGDYTGTVARA